MASVAAVASALALSSCTHATPQPPQDPSATASITIMIDPDSFEQRVLAEIYRQTLMDFGRNATVAQEPMLVRHDDHHDGVSRNGNFFIGCTGVFLNAFNPTEARTVSQDYATAQEEETGSEDFLERTHISLMASLPPELAVVEPAGAEGCSSAEPVLPENYVVVYEDGLFDREEKLEVASFTKFLTEQDLQEVVEEVKEADNFETAVRSWMEANLMQNLNEEGDSDSSGGSDLVNDTSQK